MNSDAFDQQIPRDVLEAEIDAKAHDIVREMIVPGVGVRIEGDTAQVRPAKVGVQIFKAQAQAAIERVLGARTGRPTHSHVRVGRAQGVRGIAGYRRVDAAVGKATRGVEKRGPECHSHPRPYRANEVS